jgi:GTP-binding protein
MLATVAIVGRPNVGKSTLFNRMTGKRLALVDDTPGLTRDRKESEAQIGDYMVRLIDTAGLEQTDSKSLEARMRAQTETAMRDADLILFVIDSRVGITPPDEVFADLVRRSGKPVIVIANKCEGRKGEEGLFETFSLGLGEPVALSAEHAI